MSLRDVAAWRSCFWPGTDVLRNKLDIRDPDQLAHFESLMALTRATHLPPMPATPTGLCAIHQHIFGDLYAWAGKYRLANMRHPNEQAFFCTVENIGPQVLLAFEKMDALRLEQLSAPDQFAAAIAGPIGDLIAIHPFRDGNGRTIRALIGILAQRNDLAFDQTRLDPDAWNRASSENFRTADPESLRAVIAGAICVR